MNRILMVCMANICRSPMALAAAQHLATQTGQARHFSFDAAGTHAQRAGEPMDPRARATLLARDYLPASTRSRRITAEDFERFDLILAMDEGNLAALLEQCPHPHQDKLRLLLDFAPEADEREVPDPYYGNLAGFEHVLDLCEAAARGLLATSG
jgi:protein-tyrosine phosphatase